APQRPHHPHGAHGRIGPQEPLPHGTRRDGRLPARARGRTAHEPCAAGRRLMAQSAKTLMVTAPGDHVDPGSNAVMLLDTRPYPQSLFDAGYEAITHSPSVAL